MHFDNEKTLLVEVAQNNPAAFELLFKQYHNKVYSYSIKICQSALQAEEIVQDVFIKVWINRASLPNIENFGAYIRIMARNQVLQVLKRIALETRCHALMNQDWTEQQKETENYIYYNDTRKILDRALSTLPPQQRLIYNMCHLQGMKQQEVANQLHISRLTVKAHLRRAVQTVRSIVLVDSHILVAIILSQLFKK
ncbi:RNA polymerase sigma-70 factor [Mucilaginibacter sabulilitoris]|uniref:RNA polymerase sigma-70 factor n=1 Tax=Mucilaginibacter sabulilitoris TaxID=1173583 RepID=A0ABZ0TQU8_9SPHI|nr:RNA polymerase sigma-70 factor [Mucilaginibacter sabulilitoris]WPU95236.1 RNA polymerase sigma-70 factor [Mucilaginibacter sabulilitoris]